ncbi:MAG: amino acid ABC transporter permease [Alphaproteobacteria bacterium]|nr:MAG: amino acid ABC transporter permease [Alphaproteobacteria bacterium]
MTDFTLWDIARNLLLAGRWTLLLSAIAFAGGGFFGLVLLLIRIGTGKWLRRAVSLYVELFQSTPLLMQLFMVYFGLPRLGIDVSAWLAAAVCLTLYSSAFLTDIWRGAVEAIPRGQWDGSASLGLHYLAQLRLVILPQATRMAIPPTVGFLVQLVKSTALASIVGFHELTRTAQILTVALIYFAICYPLTELSRRLERQLMTSAR